MTASKLATATMPPPAATHDKVLLEPTWCVVCGSDDPRPYKARMYALGPTRFDLVRCGQCGFVYVNPQPDAATIARLYDDSEYYSYGYNLGVETVNYFDRRDELLAIYDGTIAALEAELGGPGDLLELGSAGGFLLEAARRRGWRVRGVEVSTPAVRYSRGEFGLDIFEGQIEEADFEPASFDVVIADNVLEHCDVPLRALRQMRDLLRPGGHVLVIVPTYVNSIYFRAMLDLGQLVPRRFLGRELLRILKLDPDHDGGPPYHLYEFNRPTILRLIRQAGFEVVSRQGSVPLPAHLFKNPRPSLRERLLRLAFQCGDAAMRSGLLPGARLRVVGRRPGGS
jgi:SAM-dependent methyltransferase